MQASQQDHRTIQIVSLISSFEGNGAPCSNLYVYLFTRSGKLIECQPILGDKSTVVLTDNELLNSRIFVVQNKDKRDPRRISLETMPDFHGHEVKLLRQRGHNVYELSQVPESTWRWWKNQNHGMIPTYPLDHHDRAAPFFGSNANLSWQ